ncbi:hypothetical protein [Paraburkholderia terrae]|uniref:hypothetical protein n=1 Tax=Paraburkholderia terrae TaxID=311230 RepID=UPI0012E065C1|nr:hypothetical protein [Paraburkholderia terrae]
MSKLFCQVFSGDKPQGRGLALALGVLVFLRRLVVVFLLFAARAFSLASAWRLRGAGVAPVRGGTYFSLPPQRKVGKRKRLTPPILVFA